jgi:hypothetical protein
MAEETDKARKHPRLTGPFFALGISVGLFVIGLAADATTDRFGDSPLKFAAVAELAAIASLVWLAANLLRRAFTRNR